MNSLAASLLLLNALIAFVATAKPEVRPLVPSSNQERRVGEWSATGPPAADAFGRQARPSMTTDQPMQPSAPPRSRAGRAALAGLLAAAVAIGAAELASGVLGLTSVVVSIGDAIIELAPGALTEFTIERLGGLNRPSLIAGTLAVLALLSLGIGLLASRSFRLAATGIAVLACVGMAAAIANPQDPFPAAIVPGLAAMAAGVAALWYGLPGVRPRAAAEPAGRREFLRAVAILSVAAATTVAGGRWLQRRAGAVRERMELTLATADVPAPLLPPETDFRLEGLSPFTTPNDRFYRVDTAVQPPIVRLEDFRLRVHGMVDRELVLTFDDLLGREIIEADVTLTCVSNEVGGDLVGNARWRGIRLDEVLREAGIQDGASQLVGRAVDGYTGGFPVEQALDGRRALIAFGMNGEPLPLAHGYPVRLVVPGLYGYVSAVKWLAELEVTTFEAFDQYWVPRGWAERAPVKTQSRIDRPRSGAEISAGAYVVAGVAWAQGRGIERVEVQVDDDPWQEAELADVPGADTWRQWRHEWSASPGSHRLRVQATDGDGVTQTGDRAAPRPDGATGWHTIEVEVS